jgi:Bacterial Ig-like domain (group 1)
MKTLTRLFSLLAILVMVGCSGGGGSTGSCTFSCTPGGGVTPSAEVTELDVQINPATIVNTGTATATATITALDANRKAVSGAPITLSVDSGVITPTTGASTSGTASPVTDASGKLLATVTLGSNLALRKITVTAVNGSIQRSNSLQVVDSPISAKPSTIELIAAATSVGTGGDGVLVRAFVKDANNNTLPGTSVNFSTSTGTLASVGAITDSGGAATATLFAGADKSNRTATITVSSGTITNTLKLPINGTKLTLAGPTSLILGNSAPFDVTVLDSKSNPVPGVTITGLSSLGNAVTASPASALTDANGSVRFQYTASKAGSDALSFAGAGSTIAPNSALVVSGQDFAFTSPKASAAVPVNTAQVVTVLLRSGGQPQLGATVSFATTGGTLSASSATTDATGQASVSVQSASAGPITVQATVAGSSTTPTITTLPLVIVATVPSKLVLQISPTALPPNLGSATLNQTQVVAKVSDAAGNPVQNVVVNFTRLVDPSGGNLLQNSATTDSSGQAFVFYRSGAQSTANNGVVIGASVAGAPTVTGQASLTVNQSALFIALGTGNVISNIDPQTYNKDWTAYVTDANGIAVDGATLTIKAIPSYYFTGTLSWNGVSWTYTKDAIWRCRNEDANGNGILDPGEDDNQDGVLWPGNVIAVTPSSVATIKGRATISLQYAESYVPWVQLVLTASATVSGTESKTSAEFIVVGDAADFSNQASAPAGQVSPFGRTPSQAAVQIGACTKYF